MKVAVCLSGLTRAVRFSLPLIKKNLLEPYNGDLFVHHWNDISIGGDSLRFTDMPQDPVNDDYFLSRGACNVKSESFNDLEWDFNCIHKNPMTKRKTTAAMYYGIYAVNQLKSDQENLTGEKYDIVIRCRPDSFFINKLLDDELTQASRNSKMVFVGWSGLDHGPKEPRNRFLYEQDQTVPFVSDNFAFGNSEAMNVYADTYNHILDFRHHCPGTGIDLEGPIPASEICLGFQLRANDIDPQRTNYQYKSICGWCSTHATANSWYNTPHTPAADGLIRFEF
jgi:hypothetical protein